MAELDAARSDLGVDNARRALIASHRDIAERAEPAVASRLLLRSRVAVHGPRRRPERLRRAAAEHFRCRKRRGLRGADRVRRAAQAARCRRCSRRAADRRGDRLEHGRGAAQKARRAARGPAQRWQDAAAVYTKLLQLRPGDADAAEGLRASLHEAGRFQDLLLALNKQLRTREPIKRLKLLKEVAIQLGERPAQSLGGDRRVEGGAARGGRRRRRARRSCAWSARAAAAPAEFDSTPSAESSAAFVTGDGNREPSTRPSKRLAAKRPRLPRLRLTIAQTTTTRAEGASRIDRRRPGRVRRPRRHPAEASATDEAKRCARGAGRARCWHRAGTWRRRDVC